MRFICRRKQTINKICFRRINMHKQRIALLIACGIGIIATFLPWVNAPFIGSVSGSAGDGWFSFTFFTIAGIICLFGNRANMIKKGQVIAVIFFALLSVALGIWKLIDISSIIGRDNIFSASVTPGIGLFAIILAGIALPVIIVLMKKKNTETPASGGETEQQ